MNPKPSRLRKLSAIIRENPKFVMMRVPGRFRWVKAAVRFASNMTHRKAWNGLRVELKKRTQESVFPHVDTTRFAADLKEKGVAFGLTLPAPIVDSICEFAQRVPCYADRNPALGFPLQQRQQAEATLGKPILLAQYMNTAFDCAEIRALTEDPVLRLIAAEYLGGLPTLVGTSLWWTFPVQASEQDRMKHAHYFHSDVDDFAFVKFFFYLSDVDAGDGSHVCVPRSHHQRPHVKLSDRWKIRRYTDTEIEGIYGAEGVLDIPGVKDTGFAEDTYCVHKGTTPQHKPRLLLQIQYALFDYRNQHDEVATSRLGSLL